MAKQKSGGGGGGGAVKVKVVGQIDVEIDDVDLAKKKKKKKRLSSTTKQQQRSSGVVLSVRLTNQNYDRAAEICVDFCERHGLPTKIAGPLAIRLRNAYGKALMQRATMMTTTTAIPDDDDDDDALDGEDEGDANEERNIIVATKTEETKQQRRATTPVVVQLPSDPAEMARRVAEVKKSRRSEGETSQAFRMVTPSRVGSWNPVAKGEVTMEKNGTDSARVVRIEEKEEEEEEEEEENGELVEVVVEEHRQQETQQPGKHSALEKEESEAEEEMLEFEITPTKQDYAESFARPPDWFVEDIEGKTRNDASTPRENKTPSKKENGAPDDDDDDDDDDDSDDNSLSEKIIQASPGFKDSLKMFEALSPKKKSGFAKSPTMTAPGFISPMETKPKRYVPRDLNE